MNFMILGPETLILLHFFSYQLWFWTRFEVYWLMNMKINQNFHVKNTIFAGLAPLWSREKIVSKDRCQIQTYLSLWSDPF